MTLEMLTGKIHRAAVTQAELDYVGSITIDKDLMDAAGIYDYEKVTIADVNNGNRFETYTIPAKRGSGMVCVNGAAAALVNVGDKVIIMAYGNLTPKEIASYSPKVVFVDDENKIIRKSTYEKHGLLKDQEDEADGGEEYAVDIVIDANKGKIYDSSRKGRRGKKKDIIKVKKGKTGSEKAGKKHGR